MSSSIWRNALPWSAKQKYWCALNPARVINFYHPFTRLRLPAHKSHTPQRGHHLETHHCNSKHQSNSPWGIGGQCLHKRAWELQSNQIEACYLKSLRKKKCFIPNDCVNTDSVLYLINPFQVTRLDLKTRASRGNALSPKEHCVLCRPPLTLLSVLSFLERSCWRSDTLGLIIRREDVFRSNVGGTVRGWCAAKGACKGKRQQKLRKKERFLRALETFLHFRELPEFPILLSPRAPALVYNMRNSALIQSPHFWPLEPFPAIGQTAGRSDLKAQPTAIVRCAFPSRTDTATDRDANQYYFWQVGLHCQACQLECTHYLGGWGMLWVLRRQLQAWCIPKELYIE